MNDKKDKNKSGSQKSESGNRSRPAQESFNNNSVDYGKRRGNDVTNTFSPPVRKGEEDNGDKSD